MSAAGHAIEVGSGASQRAFRCAPGQAVLAAMCGTGQRCIPVGCRSGGCGVCRVQVVSGEYGAGQMSAARISAADRANDIVLACQLFPRSDLELRALGPAQYAADDSIAAWLRAVAAAKGG